MGKNRLLRVGDTASEQGYTLVELLVVLTIVALLVAALPAAYSAARADFEAKITAERVADDLRTVRAQAMADNRDESVVFDIKAKRYVIQPAGTVRELPLQLTWGFSDRGLLDAAASSEIRFFSDGSSSGGRLTISSPGHKYVIESHPLTGRISIDE
jgi:general secretion pathway protein H